MVKPPKTMQPEAVKLSKAGRDKSKAFTEDSFHNYMALKIDRQRQQFGLKLPPPPPPEKEKEEVSEEVVNEESESTIKLDAATAAALERKTKKKRKHKFGMMAVLKRLKIRHGEHSRKRQRKESSIDHPQKPTVESSICGDDDLPEKQSVVVAPAAKQKSPPTTTSHKRTDLFFAGVVVLVNGYTNPDTETIQRLLHRHGGDLEKYETSRITHVICERLSQAKATMYSKQKNAPIICTPSWITDSVHAKKLLPVAGYLVIREDVGGTKSVASFFKAPPSSSTVVETPQPEPGTAEGDDSTAKKQHRFSAGSNLNRFSVGDSSVYSEVPPHLSQESFGDDDDEVMMDGGLSQQCDEGAQNLEEAANDLGTHHEERTNMAKEEINTFAETGDATEQRTSPQAKAAEAATSDPQKDRYINGRIRTVGTDPTFLESFFAASRLSFIGSYKQRTKQSPTKNGTRSVGERFVFHVDMDCFFAAVVLRNFPQYRDKPVVISHHGENMRNGDNPRDIPKESSSECATCNYEARKFGIKKGMYLGQARALCPDLIILQYDFEGYEEVSEAMSGILERHASENAGYVEQVSCDEAYVEFFLTATEGEPPRAVAAKLADDIRREIFETTQCTATVGVATNKFLAKVATDHVKPNGSFVVGEFRDLLRSLQLRELHGVGYRLERKLAEEDLVSVQDVWDLGNRGERELCRILGPGLGKKIFGFCQGKDGRPVKPAERKTIGAECNYGVRFDGPYGVDHMIEGLCREVENRMTTVGVRGSKITLKVKQRKEGAPPPPKFLGHGSCHNLSKSQTVGSGEPTRAWKDFYDVVLGLFAQLNVAKEDIRGMGIVVSKLDGNEKSGKEVPNPKQNIANWFTKQSPHITENTWDEDTTTRKSVAFALPAEPRLEETEPGAPAFDDAIEEDEDDSSMVDVIETAGAASNETHRAYEDEDYDIALPALSQIRMSQVEEMPSPIRKEIVTKMEAAKARNDEACAEQTRESPQNSSRMFRQTDVKRMFRLAALKSGDHKVALGGKAVSLTQLEDLPLEMQLQVANDDTRKLGLLSPQHNHRAKRSRRKFHSSAEKPKRKSPVTVRAAKQKKKETEKKKLAEATAAATAEPMAVTDPCDFYRDNVQPLALFLDENVDAVHEAQQEVVAFLCLCVTENRMKDAVVLLRSIKNRGDIWGSEPVFDSLFEAVDAKIEESCGAGLDREWVLRGA